METDNRTAFTTEIIVKRTVRRRLRLLLLVIAGFGLFLQLLAGGGNASPQKEEKADRFKKWLEEDVPYIITEEEKGIFKKLTTDDERDKFIEQFWIRRDPNPLTGDNEFKIEYYRRIAYANDHFQSGKVGWKTDRGRLYILFGPPDEISHNPTGQVYERDLKEGGGHTTTFPYEVWFYRHLDGIGDGIEVEFVDASMTGEYRMALSPEEKDAMLNVTGTGTTLLEQLGYETREDRIRNNGIQNISGNSFRWGELNKVFDHYQRFFQLRRPPEIQFKDLQQMVSTRISYSLLSVEFNWYYLQLSPGAFLAPLTVSIPNSTLNFKELNADLKRARVEMYGVVQSLSGKIVYEFEDTLVNDVPDRILKNPRGSGASVYQRTIPMMPGHFKLSLVIKDTGTGNTTVLNKSLAIPNPPEKDLFTSSLIIGDRITPAAQGEFITDPFVVEGNLKLYPNVSGRVRNNTSIAGYIEVYNLDVDAKSLRPDWGLELELYRDGELLEMPPDTVSKIYPIFKGDKLVLCWLQSVRFEQTGAYELKVLVKDKIKGATVSAKAALEVF